MRRFRWLLAATLALAALPQGAWAQGRGTLRGAVVEQGSDRPVPGAMVAVQGTNLSAVTDAQGRYTIPNVPARTVTVRASRLGYGTATRQVAVTAGGTAEASFTLATDALGLEEVVAIGYGATERRNVAGAVSSVRPEALADIPTPQIENVLQGRAAGVQVTQNSGVPGAAMTVRVRGASSIEASNQPLYVIDGVPLIVGNFSGINGSMGGQDIDALADLNPNEIESIEILKDASAAAIYGSRASNGVVLISTKRGRALTRPDIRFNAYYGSQRAWRIPGFLNAQQYVEIFNEGYANDRAGEIYDGDDLVLTEQLFGYTNDAVPSCDLIDYDDPESPTCDVFEVNPNTNVSWVREVLDEAPMANVFGSIAGGTERTRYFVSGTWFEQEGIVAAYGYSRLNGRVNLDYSASDRLTLGTSVALTRSIIDRARGDNTIYGPFANAMATDPLSPVYADDDSGEYNFSTFAGYDNAVALMDQNRAEERGVHILGNAFATYQLGGGTSARVSAGLDHYNLRSRQYDSPIIGPWTGSGGHGAASNSYATKLLGEATLNFSRDVGAAHSVSGLVGSSYEMDDLDYNEVEGVQFPTSQFRRLTAAALIIAGDQYIEESNLMSFFGRLSHSWEDRLVTTLNMRADGSSRFQNNQWGFFPSAAVLWRLQDTPLLRGQRAVSNLALRASYGLTGNQQGIGEYSSLGLFVGGANYGDQAGIAPDQLPNPDLSWEKTTQLNLGGDVAFLDDRLSLSFDWYHKKTTDLLLGRPVPTSTGFGIITENIGSMRNAGVELAARLQVLKSDRPGGFNWTSELNLATNRNRVLELYGGQPINFDEVRIEEGQPLGVFYTYVMDGIFQSEDEICYDDTGAACGDGVGFQSPFTLPGDIRFRDVNGDGVINSADRAIVGNPWPDYQGGMTNTLAFRGFDLSVFLQFSQGNDIFNGNRLYTDANGYFFDNPSTRALNRWRPDAPNNTEPRASWFDDNQNRRSSSRFVEDGSYWRIKNAVFGYNVPDRFSSRLGVKGVRLYVQGQNLVTWTDYSGFDPEVNYAGDSNITRGYDFYTLPQARTISFGVNLGL
jgi:TonB-dependent starch-binding outer membrane protein SusC